MKGAYVMFEQSVATKKGKDELVLLRELADLVAVEKRDERLGYSKFQTQEDRIRNILMNLGYVIV